MIKRENFYFFEGPDFFIGFDLIRRKLPDGDVAYSAIMRITTTQNHQQFAFQSPVWFKSSHITILDFYSFFSSRFQLSDPECTIYDFDTGEVVDEFHFEDGVVSYDNSKSSTEVLKEETKNETEIINDIEIKKENETSNNVVYRTFGKAKKNVSPSDGFDDGPRAA